MKCKKCGAKLGKFQYCQNCGAPKDYVPAKGEKLKRRSIPWMIICILFTFIISLLLTLTMSVREIFEKSLPDALDNIRWSRIEIGRVVSGFDKNATFTEYIASFIDDPRMTKEGIEIILDSDELNLYIKDIVQNYNDVLFKKEKFKELSSQDIVDIVKANEADISFATSMPFDKIGDVIYNDIDKTLSEPIAQYNDTFGDLFTGLSVVLLRFNFSDAGIITYFVLLSVFASTAAFCFLRAGNGLKACGIAVIIPSFAIFVAALLSAVIIKLPILAELMPSIKPILMEYGLIITGFGILEIVIGAIMLAIADKMADRKAEKQAKIENNYDEPYIPKGDEKVLVMASQETKADPYSATGKIPAVSDKSKACPICGAVNPLNAKFCRNCSSKF